jgi:hypothetical protein
MGAVDIADPRRALGRSGFLATALDAEAMTSVREKGDVWWNPAGPLA